MKTRLLLSLGVLSFLAVASHAAPPAATPTNSATSHRVGVYDSRVVAYAFFSTPEHQAEIRRQTTEGRAAKDRGDTARYEQLKDQITADQKKLHLQVFSTAPIPEILAQLQDRLPDLQREAGVSRLVSKWDDDALKEIAPADRVDVTELLIRDCRLDERQQTTMRELATKEPVPLWRAKLMNMFGKM